MKSTPKVEIVLPYMIYLAERWAQVSSSPSKPYAILLMLAL